MDNLLHNVNDLPTATRSVVETLVGHPLRDDQRLYIVAFDPVEERSTEVRRAAWDELQKIMEVMKNNARDSGRSADEIDRLIDEACESVRYGG